MENIITITINGVEYNIADTTELIDTFGVEVAQMFNALATKVDVALSDDEYIEDASNPYESSLSTDEIRELKADYVKYEEDEYWGTWEKKLAWARYNRATRMLLFGKDRNLMRHDLGEGYSVGGCGTISQYDYIWSARKWQARMTLEGAERYFQNAYDLGQYGEHVAFVEHKMVGTKCIAIIVSNFNNRYRYCWTKKMIADEAVKKGA